MSLIDGERSAPSIASFSWAPVRSLRLLVLGVDAVEDVGYNGETGNIDEADDGYRVAHTQILSKLAVSLGDDRAAIQWLGDSSLTRVAATL